MSDIPASSIQLVSQSVSQPVSPVARARLILGSSSVYRADLLHRLQLPFEVIAPAVNETPLPQEPAEHTALRLAREKAISIANCHGNALIIGCDQVATLDGVQIGKPGSHYKAMHQLRMMRGRRVIFHSAICLVDNRDRDGNAPPDIQIENVQTFVTFRDLPDEELERYLSIEKPYDCAGSAKNEGLGIALIARIEGSDPTALTGLPLISLTTMLRNAHVPFFD